MAVRWLLLLLPSAHAVRAALVSPPPPRRVGRADSRPLRPPPAASPTELRAAPLPPSPVDDVAPPSSSVRGRAAPLARRLRGILWPGSAPDDDDGGSGLPLPPGSLGCPFLGSNIMEGSAEEGPEVFYSRESARLGHPPVWMFYFIGDPVASVSGGDNVRVVLGNEYGKFAIMGTDPERKRRGEPVLYGSDNVMFERDPAKHQFLRRLVGEAMTPAACAAAVPSLAEAARRRIDGLLESGGAAVMEDECEGFTLDVAWRQILGLNLDESEVPAFHKAVKDYVSGMFSLVSMLRLPGRTLTAPHRGRRYLESKIRDRIDELERAGACDGSTLSRMLFAQDEDELSSGKKLTTEEVVENALLLLIAGTETSASTLTMAVFLLGLHPPVWEELVREQRKMAVRHGPVLTKAALDAECPYLDAVIKETMRIAPLSGTNPRRAMETVALNGTSVPKGWAAFCNIRLTHELDPVTRPVDSGKAHMDVRTGFQPERWLNDEVRPSADYMPFGAGPRYCLGAGLAMAEMKTFLAILAQKAEGFNLMGVGSGDRRMRWNTGSIIPKPADGVPVLLRPREKALV